MVSFFRKKNTHVLSKRSTTRVITPLQRQMIIGCIIVLTISVLIAGVWYGTRIQSLQILHIQVIGGTTIPHSSITDKGESVLNGAYYKLIPKRFIPLYPHDALTDAVLTFNRVKNVQTELTDNQTVTIVFDEYIPYALWCNTATDETCLFIDTTGYAFAQAPSLEGSAFIRYIEDEVEPALGLHAFDVTYIQDTELFTDLLQKELSLYVTDITKHGKYDIEYTISGGGTIKISQTIPALQTFKNLETILHSKEFAHIEPGSFQYIDLRFGDKIFVNESLVSAQATSTASTSSEQ